MDAVVAHGEVRLSVRDLGGSGTPVVLLHGAGNTLVDMLPLGGHLVADHRVVAMELRGHGHSSDGPWEWEDVLGDVRAVIEQMGLARPVLVGHSLGGMLATLYADRYDDVAAAVNLDGHPLRAAAGDDESARLRELVRSVGDRMIRELGQPRSEPEIAVARQGWLAGAIALGLDVGLAAEAFDRKLVGDAKSGFTTRPATVALLQLRDAVDALDLLACYRRASVPQLVYVATREGHDPILSDELRMLAAAHRERVIDQLRAISDASPTVVRLVTIDATHGLIYECPQLLAEQIHEFVKDIA